MSAAALAYCNRSAEKDSDDSAFTIPRKPLPSGSSQSTGNLEERPEVPKSLLKQEDTAKAGDGRQEGSDDGIRPPSKGLPKSDGSSWWPSITEKLASGSVKGLIKGALESDKTKTAAWIGVSLLATAALASFASRSRMEGDFSLDDSVPEASDFSRSDDAAHPAPSFISRMLGTAKASIDRDTKPEPATLELTSSSRGWLW